MKTITGTRLVNGRTHTTMCCDKCGKERAVEGKPNTKHIERALQQPCLCSKTFHKPQHGANWWAAFGLSKNPGIYGPMPWKRTGMFWRMKEARETGLLCWRWVDGLSR